MKRIQYHGLAIAMLAITGSAQAEPIYAITGNSAGADLVKFDSGNPAAVMTIGALTGIKPGHGVRGIDLRPATGTMYTISNSGSEVQVYTVNLETAALTMVGPGFTFGAALPSNLSIDFNPVVDRLRVISASGSIPTPGSWQQRMRPWRMQPVT